MSQREINNNIEKLFDEFEKANYDINQMNQSNQSNQLNQSNHLNSNESAIGNQIESKIKINNKIVDKIDPNDVAESNRTDFIKISDKTNFTDDSLVLDMTNSFSGELLNSYAEYYKKKTNKPKHYTLLDGIDKNDPYSTNIPLEELYFEMSVFLEKEKTDPDFCKIINYDDMDHEIVKNEELYCIFENGHPKYVSLSFFSLLVELTEMKINNRNNIYTIVNIK